MVKNHEKMTDLVVRVINDLMHIFTISACCILFIHFIGFIQYKIGYFKSISKN